MFFRKRAINKSATSKTKPVHIPAPAQDGRQRKKQGRQDSARSEEISVLFNEENSLDTGRFRMACGDITAWIVSDGEMRCTSQKYTNCFV